MNADELKEKRVTAHKREYHYSDLRLFAFICGRSCVFFAYSASLRWVFGYADAIGHKGLIIQRLTGFAFLTPEPASMYTFKD